MRSKAYAPAHITGFFEICEHSDQRQMGSKGCGFTLQAGVATEVLVEEGEGISVIINGAKADAPTTRSVVRRLASGYFVEVRSKIEVPIGCGFGASGAGALSTALALSNALSLDLSYNGAAEVAHVAEIENKTGLGDVIAQTHGGIIIRRKPGAPGIGEVDRVPVSDVEVNHVVLGEISTKDVLEDEKLKGRINRAGRIALKGLLKRPTIQNFMQLSNQFAIDTGLMSDAVADIIESVKSGGGMASMAMLGEVVFAIGGYDSLKDFGPVRTYKISHGGARLL
ncbi:MAG: pantoate kinase [Methanocellales archaeon]|nr:pantoate kinase [Methanocellales archaeon]MDD3291659.1 pantoate kinase [Methanocellales archaeon]MDD5235228.1 pantoate kinase [Methanocellales archaeon]MDD5485442.1 pantoate kinase [Methanocellales archaeon]